MADHREFEDIPRHDDPVPHNDPDFDQPEHPPSESAGDAPAGEQAYGGAGGGGAPPNPPGYGDHDPGYGGFDTTSDDRTWGMLAHLSALIALMLGGFGVLGPLIVWLIKKDQSAFVDDQGKEALNFQILILVIFFALGAVSIVTCGLALVITGPLMLVLAIVDIVMVIIAGIAANRGERYRYPFNWRIVK
jgi:hypothetical protein